MQVLRHSVPERGENYLSIDKEKNTV